MQLINNSSLYVIRTTTTLIYVITSWPILTLFEPESKFKKMSLNHNTCSQGRPWGGQSGATAQGPQLDWAPNFYLVLNRLYVAIFYSNLVFHFF